MAEEGELSTCRERSLMERHPNQVAVPIALALSTILLFVGLSLPLMDAQTGILWKRWKSSYSVWAGVVALWYQHEYLLASVLFFFSMVFPLTKLLALAVIWFVRLADDQRTQLLHWLGLLGKWSMLDVFAVAILIVLVKLGPLANVQPRVGVYVFSAAILASMFTTMYVDRLARQSLRPTK
jgi:paraquat-inducible protein A